MNWLKATEVLPVEDQEVLLRFKSIVNLADYNSVRSQFRLKSGEILPGTQSGLLWCSLSECKTRRVSPLKGSESPAGLTGR